MLIIGKIFKKTAMDIILKVTGHAVKLSSGKKKILGFYFDNSLN